MSIKKTPDHKISIQSDQLGTLGKNNNNNNKQRITEKSKSPRRLPIFEFIWDKNYISVLEAETIPFGSPKQLIDKFDQLVQSHFFLIKKNQENQDKCFAIAKKLKNKNQKKQEQLKGLKINKAFLTQKFKSTID